MKVLIVGGNSSVSRALIPVLSAFCSVMTAGRKGCDITLDLDDPIEQINLPEDIDVVILAASNFGGSHPQDIYAAENTNVLGALKICQVATTKKVKQLIMLSSMFATLDPSSDFYNIYALSKRHAEEVARFYCALHALPLCILRPSQLYGNDTQFKKHQPFFYSIIEKAEHDQEIEFYGTHDARRNYLHIDDLTNIIAQVVKKKIIGTYACMNMQDASYMQIAQAAFLAFRRQPRIRFNPNKPDIADNIFAQDSRLYELISFYPQVAIEAGIEKIALYRRSGVPL